MLHTRLWELLMGALIALNFFKEIIKFLRLLRNLKKYDLNIFNPYKNFLN
tara:strand:- start:362 stop:511 length:150 start_codon:yes stop_codon:yes gene_type:complete